MIKLNRVASKIFKMRVWAFSTSTPQHLSEKTLADKLKGINYLKNEEDYKSFIVELYDKEGKLDVLHQFLKDSIMKDSDYFIGDDFQGEEGRMKFINCIQDLAFIASNKLSQREKQDFIKNISFISSKINVGIRQALLKAEFYSDLFKKKLMKVVDGSEREKELKDFISHINAKKREFYFIVKILLNEELTEQEWDYVYDRTKKMRSSYEKHPICNKTEATLVDTINDALVACKGHDMIFIDKGDENLDLSFDDQLKKISPNKKAPIDVDQRFDEYRLDEELQNLSDNPHEKLEVENIQDYKEDTTLEHPFTYKQTNWVYLMDLPYDFSEEKYKKLISQRFSSFGKVKQIIFQKYCNHVTKLEENKVIFHDMGDMEVAHKFIEQNMNTSPAKATRLQEVQKMNKLDSNCSLSSLQRSKGTNIINKMDKDKIRFRKSYALIEMDTYEQKMSLITPSTRVFGIYLEDKCSKVEDADYKTYLYIDNLPYGYKMSKIIEKLNATLKQHNMEEFQINETMGNKVIVNNSITLGFRNFDSALRAFKYFKGVTIFERHIKIDFLYGNLKQIDGQFVDCKISVNNKSIGKILSAINNLEKDTIAQQDNLKKGNNFNMESTDDNLLEIMQDFSNDVLANTFDAFDMIDNLKYFEHVKDDLGSNHLTP